MSPTLMDAERQSPCDKLASTAQKEVHSDSRLPSPSPSIAGAQHASGKRRHSDNITFRREEEGRRPKRRQLVQGITESSPLTTSDRITYWVETFSWPPLDSQEWSNMSLPKPQKRKKSFTHHSDQSQLLKQNGIYMATSRQLQQASKDFCSRLLGGNLTPDRDELPGFPIEKVSNVLERISQLNEARIQRDITPWVVPSVENLVFSGKLVYEYLGEEIDECWIRCATMGGTKPKPDFCVGLQRSAFDEAEWAKLDHCATSSNTFCCTPNLWFPFLVCEVKSARDGLGHADMRNIHSCSIAVRSVLRVCIAAYGRYDQRVEDLLGRILVFSVSHNNQQASIYGHYAVAKGEDFEYYRCVVALFSLEGPGNQRYGTYNFVRNLYNEFAPQHRDRLRDAISALPKPGPFARPSVAASGLALDDEEEGEESSQVVGSQQEGVFKLPSEPASAAALREMKSEIEQLKAKLSSERALREQAEREIGNPKS